MGLQNEIWDRPKVKAVYPDGRSRKRAWLIIEDPDPALCPPKHTEGELCPDGKWRWKNPAKANAVPAVTGYRLQCAPADKRTGGADEFRPGGKRRTYPRTAEKTVIELTMDDLLAAGWMPGEYKFSVAPLVRGEIGMPSGRYSLEIRVKLV